MGRLVSEHADRRVYDEGDTFVKEFVRPRDLHAECERYEWLAAAGVGVPQVLMADQGRLVTRRLPGKPLDDWIREHWRATPRAARNALIERVARLCARIRDARLAWPDLVTYHIFVAPDSLAVLDPARVRRGKLDLSALYWSTDEPTVSRADRLRFWRAYAGSAPLPRIRAIGHRGRFRPYRWVHQRTAIKPLPPFAPFVAAVPTSHTSADAIADDPALVIKRTLTERTNARLHEWHVKITKNPDEARAEWENHRRLLASGFRVPQPAVAGLLKDGRGLFASVDLAGRQPLDDVAATLNPRVAARAIADVTRRLHAGGLVHRDLYLCHFFVQPHDGRAPALIDLARVEATRSTRRRIKDLAAIAHSADGLLPRTALLRALYRYGGDRRLARRVVRKARRMARHIPKNVRDGTHVPHAPCTSAS